MGPYHCPTVAQKEYSHETHTFEDEWAHMLGRGDTFEIRTHKAKWEIQILDDGSLDVRVIHNPGDPSVRVQATFDSANMIRLRTGALHDSRGER